MKAILISINPKYVAQILNGQKTIEIRKTCPRQYLHDRCFEAYDVYIYCTKDKNASLHKNIADIWWVEDKEFRAKNKRIGIKQQPIYNGKVVAKFSLVDVEEIKCVTTNDGFAIERYITENCNVVDLMDKSCLYFEQLKDYLYYSNGYAWHIEDLRIFDRPMELSEFNIKIRDNVYRKIKAPQSWCYIEI